MKTRILMILIALDVFLFSVVCLGNVKRSECASSAAWDMKRAGKWQGKVAVAVIDTLFFFDPNHCLLSWQGQPEIYK